jgi:hypothetical protein
LIHIDFYCGVVIPKALRVARTGIRAARRGEARSSTPPVQSGDLVQNDAPPSADVRPSAFYGFLVVQPLGGSRRVHVVSSGENGSVVVLWSAATRADGDCMKRHRQVCACSCCGSYGNNGLLGLLRNSWAL